MKFSTVLFAVLPALALAQEETTSTETATTTLTKTIQLALHTVTSHTNGTIPTPTPVETSSLFSSATSAEPSSTDEVPGPAESSNEPGSAAPKVGAANVALAGVVGVVVMAML